MRRRRGTIDRRGGEKRREEKREEKRTDRERRRHEGCMAVQPAVLYQDAAVGRLRPNSRKSCSMPSTQHLLITPQLLA